MENKKTILLNETQLVDLITSTILDLPLLTEIVGCPKLGKYNPTPWINEQYDGRVWFGCSKCNNGWYGKTSDAKGPPTRQRMMGGSYRCKEIKLNGKWKTQKKPWNGPTCFDFTHRNRADGKKYCALKYGGEAAIQEYEKQEEQALVVKDYLDIWGSYGHSILKKDSDGNYVWGDWRNPGGMYSLVNSPKETRGLSYAQWISKNKIDVKKFRDEYDGTNVWETVSYLAALVHDKEMRELHKKARPPRAPNARRFTVHDNCIVDVDPETGYQGIGHIQKFLRRMGYEYVQVDGGLGDMTSEAIGHYLQLEEPGWRGDVDYYRPNVPWWLRSETIPKEISKGRGMYPWAIKGQDYITTKDGLYRALKGIKKGHEVVRQGYHNPGNRAQHVFSLKWKPILSGGVGKNTIKALVDSLEDECGRINSQTMGFENPPVVDITGDDQTDYFVKGTPRLFQEFFGTWNHELIRSAQNLDNNMMNYKGWYDVDKNDFKADWCVDRGFAITEEYPDECDKMWDSPNAPDGRLNYWIANVIHHMGTHIQQISGRCVKRIEKDTGTCTKLFTRGGTYDKVTFYDTLISADSPKDEKTSLDRSFCCPKCSHANRQSSFKCLKAYVATKYNGNYIQLLEDEIGTRNVQKVLELIDVKMDFNHDHPSWVEELVTGFCSIYGKSVNKLECLEYTMDIIAVIGIFLGPAGWVVSGIAGIISIGAMVAQGKYGWAIVAGVFEIFGVLKIVKFLKNVKHLKNLKNSDSAIEAAVKYFDEPTEAAFKGLSAEAKIVVQYMRQEKYLVARVINAAQKSDVRKVINAIKTEAEFIKAYKLGKIDSLGAIGWNEFKKLKAALTQADIDAQKIVKAIKVVGVAVPAFVAAAYVLSKAVKGLHLLFGWETPDEQKTALELLGVDTEDMDADEIEAKLKLIMKEEGMCMFYASMRCLLGDSPCGLGLRPWLDEQVTKKLKKTSGKLESDTAGYKLNYLLDGKTEEEAEELLDEVFEFYDKDICFECFTEQYIDGGIMDLQPQDCDEIPFD